jgi:3-oxoacyl-[acyl-carrier protein] reductase
VTRGRTLVTGATRGIGRAICDRLLAAGCDVVGLARTRDPAFPAPLFVADLADEASTAAGIEAVLAAGPVDNLVNNAGISSMQRVADLDIEEMRRVLEVNLRAPAQLARSLLPAMAARGYGRVVNITSRAQMGRAGLSAYAASKAGLDAMTRVWALEHAECGVTVNAVAPGVTDTPMFSASSPPGSERERSVMTAIPMHRAGAPGEVAAAVAYFLSEAAGYTTGQTLHVCGGWSIATP